MTYSLSKWVPTILCVLVSFIPSRSNRTCCWGPSILLVITRRSSKNGYRAIRSCKWSGKCIRQAIISPILTSFPSTSFLIANWSVQFLCTPKWCMSCNRRWHVSYVHSKKPLAGKYPFWITEGYKLVKSKNASCLSGFSGLKFGIFGIFPTDILLDAVTNPPILLSKYS